VAAALMGRRGARRLVGGLSQPRRCMARGPMAKQQLPSSAGSAAPGRTCMRYCAQYWRSLGLRSLVPALTRIATSLVLWQ
jgi:hypothetical protein